VAPLNHAEALVHIRIRGGRWAAARRDQGHRLSRRELAIADRLGCGLHRAERGLDDNGGADRLEIDRRGLANGYVALRSTGAGYPGLRPLQLQRRGYLHVRCRRQCEITLQSDGGLLLCLLIASRGTRRDYDRQREQKTSTHDFSTVLDSYAGRSLI
jgi:hypothetical protein